MRDRRLKGSMSDLVRSICPVEVEMVLARKCLSTRSAQSN